MEKLVTGFQTLVVTVMAGTGLLVMVYTAYLIIPVLILGVVALIAYGAVKINRGGF